MLGVSRGCTEAQATESDTSASCCWVVATACHANISPAPEVLLRLLSCLQVELELQKKGSLLAGIGLVGAWAWHLLLLVHA